MKKNAPAECQTTPVAISARPDGFLDWLFNWLDKSLVQQTAGEVARECHHEIWEMLGDQLVGLTPAKSRGYVRACALEVILDEVEPVMLRRRVRAGLQPQVVDAALDQLADLMARDASRLRQQRRMGRAA